MKKYLVNYLKPEFKECTPEDWSWSWCPMCDGDGVDRIDHDEPCQWCLGCGRLSFDLAEQVKDAIGEYDPSELS